MAKNNEEYSSPLSKTLQNHHLHSLPLPLYIPN